MSKVIDYTNRSSDELAEELKKLKRQQIFSAGMIGFFIGIIVYGYFKNGFGWVYISISLFMIYLINRNSKSLKNKIDLIKEELAKR